MYLRKSFFGTASMLSLAGILALSGCSSDANGSNDDSTDHAHGLGGLGMALSLPDGSNVNDPTYTITRTNTPGFTPLTGTLQISGSVATGTITGLEAGTDYKVVLSATRSSPANAPACTGSATFVVVASATTNVNVVLQCDDTSGDVGNITINGEFNICPKIGSTTATPVSTTVGTPVSITANATDKDVSDVVAYTWSSADGTFANASANSTTYTCTSAGTKTLNLSVTDGPARGCVKTLATPITITCVGASLDAGTPVSPDASTPVVPDASTPVTPDASTPVTPDASTPVTPDASTPVTPDAGSTPLTESAACTACKQTNCSNYLGVLPLLDNCQDAACKAIVTCAQDAHIITGPLNVTNPYCGNLPGFDECNVAAYVPNGPCKALIEAGVQSTVKDTVLERYIDPDYVGGNANYLLTCEADLCLSECL